MRFKYFWRILLALVGLAILIALVVPVSRTILFGLLRGESIAEDFMPLSYHIERLRDPNVHVRANAINRISQMGSKAGPAVAPLVALMRDPELGRQRTPSSREFRDAVVTTLGLIGPTAREAVPALTELLTDPDPMMRLNVASALGKIGPDAITAVPALTKALRDEVSAVRTYAVRALHRLDFAALKRGLADAMGDDRPDVRVGIAEKIGELGPKGKELRPVLQKALQDPDNEVARAAREALERFGPSQDDEKNDP